MRYPVYKFFPTNTSSLIPVGLFANQAFEGDSLMSPDQFMSIYQANPDHALYHVERTLSRGEKPGVCGVISFSFLSAAVAQSLKDGELETKDLSGEHQVKRPDVVYLAAIAGDRNDKQARRATILFLLHLFVKFRTEFNGVSFMTKPISKSGLNLVTTRLGFVPCEPSREGIDCLYEMP